MEIELSSLPAAPKIERLKSAARLRLRVSDLLNSALKAAGLKKSDLGKRLGIDRASVTQTLRGNGNVTINTLAEYLAAMGLEADIQVVRHGEILQSMVEHRAPRTYALTIRDSHRRNVRPAIVSQFDESRQVHSGISTRQVFEVTGANLNRPKPAQQASSSQTIYLKRRLP